MDLKILQSKIEEMLKKHGFRLASLAFVTEDKDRYLRVIVDKYHHNISLDEIVMLSELIDDFIAEDDDEASFILDVTTTGAEKEVALDEVKDYIGKALFVTMKDGIKGPQTYEGILSLYVDEELTLQINKKGRKLERVIKLSDIKNVRRAVLM